MSLYTLEKAAYKLFLADLDLNLLKANTFGLEEHYPLEDKKAIDKLYNDYKQREQWLELFLIKKIKKESLKYIVWSESARIGNNQYIYKMENNRFIYESRPSNYFKEVKESNTFNACIVIDFFGLVGLNHSNDSRNFLNKQASQKNKEYNEYLQKYINSILTIIKLNKDDFVKLTHVIAAPAKTTDSIISYLTSELGFKHKIKTYKLNSMGLVKK